MQPNHNNLNKYPIVLHKILKKLHSFPDSILQKYNLSRIHVHYLVHLQGCSNDLNAQDISEALGVNKANTSRALNDLIAQGYILKTKKGHKNILHLTDTGKQIAIELKEHNANQMHNLLNVLTEEERISLRIILKKISDSL